VGHDDHRLGQARLQVAELVLQAGADQRIERAEGFVHEQDRRIRGQGAGEADALPLAAAELRREPSGDLRGVEAEQGEQLVNALTLPLGRPAEQVGDDRGVIGRGEVREEAGLLHDVPDAPAQGDRIERRAVLAVDDDAPGRRLQEAVDELQQRGLAAPRGPEQGQGGSCGDAQ
jgi:hypothetical protein